MTTCSKPRCSLRRLAPVVALLPCHASRRTYIQDESPARRWQEAIPASHSTPSTLAGLSPSSLGVSVSRVLLGVNKSSGIAFTHHPPLSADAQIGIDGISIQFVNARFFCVER